MRPERAWAAEYKRLQVSPNIKTPSCSAICVFCTAAFPPKQEKEKQHSQFISNLAVWSPLAVVCAQSPEIIFLFCNYFGSSQL